MAEVLWDRTTGTNIGDMTGGGGLAAAFDGNLSQANSASAVGANRGATGGYVGKDFGSGNAKPLSKIVVRSTNNIGFTNTGNVTLTLYGKNTAPANPSDGTSLGTNSIGSGGSNSTDYTVTSSDTVTAYRYAWAKIASSGVNADCYCCELSIYYIGSTTFNQAVSATCAGAVAVTKRASRTLAIPSLSAVLVNKRSNKVLSTTSSSSVVLVTARIVAAVISAVCASTVAMARSPRKSISVASATVVSFTKRASRTVSVGCSSVVAVVRSATATLILGCLTTVALTKRVLKAVTVSLASFVAWVLHYWQQRPEQQEDWTARQTDAEAWTERGSEAETWAERTVNDQNWIERPKSNEPWT